MTLIESEFTTRLQALTEIGIALSAEKDHMRLLEVILMKAQELTNSDGGTIYTCTKNSKLKFEIMINKSMNIHLGGTSDNKIPFDDLSLYDEEGQPNQHMLAPSAVISRKTINIEDAYSDTTFDLSGTKNFDKKTGYHSKSFLTVPMTNHLHEVIGVLQLINTLDKNTKEIRSFSKVDQLLVESLASQAAIIITNKQLIDAQKELFNALIQLIAQAIDEKSPYTGNHCRRVPVITQMLAKATCEITKGPLKEFTMSDDELYELEVAAWLHDCGKITTPEAVVDKASKLEMIFDLVHLIDLRFEVVKRDLMINTLKENIQQVTGNPINLLEDKRLQEQLQLLDEEREIIRKCNVGGEHLQPAQIEAINKIAKRKWVTPTNEEEYFLTDTESKLLEISRGTLSKDERQVINNHVKVTIKMLQSLPYPKGLKNVPHLAGSHHEKIDGTGYPNGLTKDQLSVPARMIAIADIFEALTSKDRPYKKAMPLSKALQIMGQMKIDGHIDPDLFDVFMDSKIYQRYAENYLDSSECDVVDLSTIPGYQALL